MSISFACTSCSAKLRAKPELSGKVGKCPKCGQPITVPRQADEKPPIQRSTDPPAWSKPVDVSPEAGETYYFEGHSGWVMSVAFSPDGQFILAGGGGDGYNLHLWSSVTGKLVRRLSGHSNQINQVGFADFYFCASASNDNTIRIWDLSNWGQQLYCLQHTEEATCFAFSGNRQQVAGIVTGSLNRPMRVWDAGCEIRSIGQQNTSSAAGCIAISPNGQLVLSTCALGLQLQLCDMTTGGVIRQFGGDEGMVECVAFSHDGELAASGGYGQAVRIWEVLSGKEVQRFLGHSDRIRSVAFSPDHYHAASCGNDGSIRLWDLNTGDEALCVRDQGAFTSLAFSPCGRFLLVGGGPRKDDPPNFKNVRLLGLPRYW